MAVKSNLTNMVVCLTATCLICSAILGVVYAVTYDPIAATNEKILKDSIGQVVPEGGEISEKMDLEVGGLPSEYYTSVKDGEVEAYAIKSQTNGFGGPLILMVGVLNDGTIYNTSVLSHSETPGLGAKCTSDEKFISQWKGFDPSVKKLSVTKDGGDVDAITASTITSRAYTLAIENAVKAADALAGQNKEEE